MSAIKNMIEIEKSTKSEERLYALLERIYGLNKKEIEALLSN